MTSSTVKLCPEGEPDSESIELMQVEGRYFPNFGQEKAEELTRLAGFQTRHDDVWLASYPKSGTHWLWEILRMLLAGTTDIETVTKDVGMVELATYQELDKLKSPRVLNSHIQPEMLRSVLMKTTAKVVYVYRNPKDVFVSFWHHCLNLKCYNYRGSWPGFFKLNISGKVEYGSWSGHIRGWYQLSQELGDRFIAVSYEDLTQHPEQCVRRLAEQLQVTCTDDVIAAIIKKTSFGAMQQRSNAAEDPNEYVNGKPRMLRKGKVGGWKDQFSEEESRVVDQILAQGLEGIPFPVVCEL